MVGAFASQDKPCFLNLEVLTASAGHVFFFNGRVTKLVYKLLWLFKVPIGMDSVILFDFFFTFFVYLNGNNF